jgi:hypothetical protein
MLDGGAVLRNATLPGVHGGRIGTFSSDRLESPNGFSSRRPPDRGLGGIGKWASPLSCRLRSLEASNSTRASQPRIVLSFASSHMARADAVLRTRVDVVSGQEVRLMLGGVRRLLW